MYKKTMLMLTQHTAFRGDKPIPTRTRDVNCKLRKGDTRHFSKNQQCDIQKQNNSLRRLHTHTHARTHARTHAHTHTHIHEERERACP